MKHLIFTFLSLWYLTATAQTISTFEAFDLEADTFLNGSDGSGGFSDGAIFLPNAYDAEFGSWSGWSISSKTDTLTPGFLNQYSAASGSGVNGSKTYAISIAFSPTMMHLDENARGEMVNGLYLNNSTYARLSMLEGDSFAKKFGGETGDDPDFFLLTIQKYLNGELSEEKVEFYLADYRFEDNSQDFIVSDWTFVDLTSLGPADSLSFSLSSSDVGQFGMNTPAYFCIDNVSVGEMTAASKDSTIAHFENFELAIDSFLNGSDGSGGFASGPVFLPNEYNPEFSSWSGWSISTKTDVTTPGFLNQYSSASGAGADDSPAYAVSIAFSPTVMKLRERFLGSTVEGLYLNNSTYARLSMLEGDSFAKKFGGETGDDPDFFLLTIQKYLNGELSEEKVEFYLADYRFEDNSQDFIVSDWTFVDLTSLGPADSLSFSLSSSDVGQFGMNTPAYFCVDNVKVQAGPVTSVWSAAPQKALTIFPNPAREFLRLDWPERGDATLAIYDLYGRDQVRQRISFGRNQIALDDLTAGTYVLRILNSKEWKTAIFIKQ